MEKITQVLLCFRYYYNIVCAVHFMNYCRQTQKLRSCK